jgi:uncharacterized protein (DUF488 family)
MAEALPLATIGYEAATQADVIGRLKAARVELLIDVRAISASRRPGFSKTMLAASLAEAGLDYLHLRALGTPKAGREAAHAGRIEEMRKIYEAHLEEPDALAQLAQATEASERRRTALLCYEADAARRHRTIVAERISAVTGAKVMNL